MSGGAIAARLVCYYSRNTHIIKRAAIFFQRLGFFLDPAHSYSSGMLGDSGITASTGETFAWLLGPSTLGDDAVNDLVRLGIKSMDCWLRFRMQLSMQSMITSRIKRARDELFDVEGLAW